MSGTIFSKVKVIILDIDGVFTNGKKIYNLTGGVVGKEFLDQDFTALNVLKKYFKIVFISGDDRVNKAVFSKYNFYHSRKRDKKYYIRTIFKRYNIGPDECLFVGDDLPDLKCMQMIPLSFCPSNAVSSIKNIAYDVIPVSGGDGVIVYLLDMLSEEIMLRRKYGREL